MRHRTLWTLLALLLIAAGAYAGYLFMLAPPLPTGFDYGSGHVEAGEVLVEIDTLRSRDQLAAAQDDASTGLANRIAAPIGRLMMALVGMAFAAAWMLQRRPVLSIASLPSTPPPEHGRLR